MYNKSVKQGLSLEKYAQSVTDSLHLAQQYTFKNGVSGLTSMAEKAAKMKLDISEAVKLAEKVSSVEGAVDVASQLQVLGGAFTNFADPMGLLYDSLNNMEGMQDRLSELVGQFGSFNRNTGEIEIATFDKLRLKQAASAMGVDYGKLIESATHQAKRGEIEAQMAGLTNIPEEYKEILMNTATFKNGVAGAVGTDGKFTELSKLDGDDLKAIADYSKSDSENIRDIAQMMRGMTDIREGQAKAEEDARTGYFRTQAELVKEGYQKIGENTRVLQQLVQIQFANSLKEAIISPMASVGKQALGKALELVLSKKANGGIIKTHSEGDVITNGTPGKEYVLNSAQYGEFIVNKQSTQHHLGLLKAINADKNGSLKINKHDFGGAIGMPMDNLLLMSSLNGIFRNPSQFLMQNNPFNEVIKTNTQILKELKSAMEGLQEGDSYRNELMDSIKELEDKNISLDKLSTKYLSKVPKIGKAINVIGKIGGPMMASVNALSSSISQYKADGTNIIDKGKAVGGTVGSTAGAAIGAALLSFAGPVGMMIGSQIGQIGGKVIGEAIGKGSKARRNRKYGEIEDELRAKNARGANVFGSLKGNFSVREMRKIAAALEDGSIGESELSDNLMEKIKITDNYDNLVNKRYSRGGYIIGKSHGEGGVKMFEAEGGEFIVNKQATAKSLNILTKINDGSINDSNIRAREPMGKQIRVSEHYANNVNEPRSVKMEPLKIDINGTIKLDSGNQSFDLSKELFNNPLFINKLTDIITKQMNINDNGSFNKQTYYQRYSTI